MIQPWRPASITRVFPIAILCSLAACATAPGGLATSADRQLSIEGRVVTVDTDPWAYDGNAVVTVDTGSERIHVHLPARWNLCKAQPVGDLQALKPGNRVQAVGSSTMPGELVVCEQPQHVLRKLD